MDTLVWKPAQAGYFLSLLSRHKPINFVFKTIHFCHLLKILSDI